MSQALSRRAKRPLHRLLLSAPSFVKLVNHLRYAYVLGVVFSIDGPTCTR